MKFKCNKVMWRKCQFRLFKETLAGKISIGLSVACLLLMVFGSLAVYLYAAPLAGHGGNSEDLHIMLAVIVFSMSAWGLFMAIVCGWRQASIHFVRRRYHSLEISELGELNLVYSHVGGGPPSRRIAVTALLSNCAVAHDLKTDSFTITGSVYAGSFVAGVEKPCFDIALLHPIQGVEIENCFEPQVKGYLQKLCSGWSVAGEQGPPREEKGERSRA